MYPELRRRALKLVYHQTSRRCANHGHGVALGGGRGQAHDSERGHKDR